MRFAFIIAILITLVVANPSFAKQGGEEPIYTPVAGQLLALDPATGRAKFALKFDTQKLSKPVVVGDTLYVAGEHDLYALDAHDGHTRWQYTSKEAIFGLAANEKHLFIGAGSTLVSLNREAGHVLWQFDGDIPVIDPVLVHDLVVFNCLEGPAGVEQQGGKLRWQLSVQWGRFVFSPLNDGRLCVWKPDEIYVVETERGKTLWHSSADESVLAPGALPEAAVATADLICQLRGTQKDSNDFSLYTRDAGSGRQIWRTPLGEHDPVGAKTAIAGKSAFCVLEDQLSAVDLTNGKVTWHATIKPMEAGGAGMAVGDGRIFAPALGGDLTALDATNGKSLWTSPAQQPAAGAELRVGGVCVGAEGVYITRNEQVRHG